AKEQEKMANLVPQHGLQNRHHRRDAGTGGEGDKGACRSGLDRYAETSARCHYSQLVARPQMMVGPAGERACLDTLDDDPKFAVIEAGADRIGAPHVLAIDRGAQGEVLAWRV